MGGNWTRTRVLSSYTGRSLAGIMVRWARWGLRPTEVSQLRGSHLLLSLCQWSQAELEVIQTAMGNISISLNMVSVNTVLANETFLQESNQQLLDSRVLCPYWYDPQSRPAIGMWIKHSEEYMDPGKDGHQIPQVIKMITNYAHLGSLCQQIRALLMKTEMGLLTFEKEEKLRKNIKGNKLHF